MALCAGVPGENILLLSQAFPSFNREQGPLSQGAGNEQETLVGDDGNERRPRAGRDGKEKERKKIK